MAPPPRTTDRQSIGLLALYAYTERTSRLPVDVRYALEAILCAVDRVVVVCPAGSSLEVRAEIEGMGAEAVQASGTDFCSRWYVDVLRNDPLNECDRVILTGDSWLGPTTPFEGTIRAMRSADVDIWQLVQNANLTRAAFPEQGFARAARPWIWTAVRASVVRSAEWLALLASQGGPDAEWTIGQSASELGWTVGYGFPAGDFPSGDPGLHHAALLLDAGCPVVDKAVFQGYPPLLNRLGIDGRALVAVIQATGFPMELLWSALVRTTPPKVLNTNAGMLEVLGGAQDVTEVESCRIAVTARVTDIDGFDALLERIRNFSAPADLYFTTTDGLTAGRMERALEVGWPDLRGRYEVRVTPVSPGKDMADFFVACRDVLLSDRYDLIVKLDLRKYSNRTLNAARYVRRYQLDNLLHSPGYVRDVIALFDREPGLGVVFPPMIHIGFQTMGHGWMGLEDQANRLSHELGIAVPLDRVSPLAPYGGMFIARPAALRLIAQRRWTYRDYRQGGRWHANLHQLQERLIPAAAATAGFHTRTVLTPEHAAIGHTSLEYTADEMFSTTRGYPVEQITLLHRLGYTGSGDSRALVRMIITGNYPRLGTLLTPMSKVARAGFRVTRGIARHVVGLRGRLRASRVERTQ